MGFKSHGIFWDLGIYGIFGISGSKPNPKKSHEILLREIPRPTMYETGHEATLTREIGETREAREVHGIERSSGLRMQWWQTSGLKMQVRSTSVVMVLCNVQDVNVCNDGAL